MKVRVSIVYEFERREYTGQSNSKTSILSDTIIALYNMPMKDLEPLARVQEAKETWLDVED
jgi:hypothetical protein